MRQRLDFTPHFIPITPRYCAILKQTFHTIVVSLLKKKKFTSLKILQHHRQKTRLTKGIQLFLFHTIFPSSSSPLNLHDSIMGARKSVGGPKRCQEENKKDDTTEIKEG
jgi:hypothetical protein